MPTSSFGSGGASGQISTALDTAQGQMGQLTSVASTAIMALGAIGGVVFVFGLITGKPNWGLAGILGVAAYAGSFFM